MRQAHPDAALTDMLDGSRRMAHEFIPRVGRGINVMHDLGRGR